MKKTDKWYLMTSANVNVGMLSRKCIRHIIGYKSHITLNRNIVIPNKKRPSNTKNTTTALIATANENEKNLTDEFSAETKSNTPTKRQKLSTTKWDSPEALKLFTPTYKMSNPAFQQNYLNDDYDQELFIKNNIKEQIQLFKRAWLTESGWKAVIHDQDQFNYYTSHSIFHLRNQCKYICKSLERVLEDYDSSTWRDCCKDAEMVSHLQPQKQPMFHKPIHKL